MPWEALNKQLDDLKAKVDRAGPYWVVQSGNDSFSAHPAFLESHRATGTLAAMVRGDIAALGKSRVVTDGQLKRDMSTVRQALGIKAGHYTDVSDQIRLWRHWQVVEVMGVVLGAPEIVREAGAFAAQQGATCADFVHAQAAFLAAGQSLFVRSPAALPAADQPPQTNTYVSASHRSELTRRYDLALEAAGKAQPLDIGDESVWAAHSLPFVETVQKRAAELSFGSPQAVVGHALKHLRRDVGDLSGEVDEQVIGGLVGGYLDDARGKIAATEAGAVTSALDQCAGSRTYYFGGQGEVTMVAVSHIGLTWISTYYAPHRG